MSCRSCCLGCMVINNRVLDRQKYNTDYMVVNNQDKIFLFFFKFFNFIVFQDSPWEEGKAKKP